ncbi:MAG: LacI family DNA-binding transcriptional regulator [Clostridia bacterium]|nr:LacI family DNA-binding transcriptional regulator [Clostridia bacterium]
MQSKNRVSSKDVAKEAGVSQATVSYVLNNVEHIKIRPETRQAVWDAVKKLNYYPNHIARGMKLKRSMSVGVITDRSVTNYNFMKTLEGIKNGLSKFNYSITLLFDTQEEHFQTELMSYYNTSRLDGFIFAFADLDDSIREKLDAKEVPYVLIDSHASNNGAHVVATDHLAYIPELTALFKEKGADRMAYVGPHWKQRTDPRLQAFQEAVENNQQQNCGLWLGPFRDEEIHEMVRNLLKQSNPPQGILAGSPRFGYHALKAAAELGLAVPEDLLVASLGTSAFYDLCQPSMTAVELPLYDMGFAGAEVLVDIMNNNTVDRVRILPSEIFLRGSL